MAEELGIHYTPTEIGSIWRPKWFLVTRFLAVIGVFFAMLGGIFIFRIETLNYHALILMCSILLLSNILYLIYYKIGKIESTLEAHVLAKKITRFIKVQINSDLIILSLMLHFSGGATNPFILYYFFHTILSSILLSKLGAYIEATVAVVLFSAMAILEGHGIIAHYDLFCPEYYTKPMFIYGMIFAVASALYIAVYMATSIMDSLRHHEEELEKALQQQRRLEEEKSRFLDVVVHDLKSPLAAIDTMVSTALAVHGDKMLPDVKRIMERIPKRTSGLIEFIKELLEFSKVEKIEELDVSFENLDLLPILENTIEMNMSQAVKKSIDLSLVVPSSLPPIKGDPDLLARMAGNLVSNAIRYTGDGGKVTVTLSENQGTLVMKVEDNGIGIPQKALPHIFNDFYRADNAKKFNTAGTGLGMSIIKAVVDKHGGTITVESEEGRGSVFTVTLPVSQDHISQ